MKRVMCATVLHRVGSLVVAAVVLATSALAPALRHSHPGGDVDHQHHAGHEEPWHDDGHTLDRCVPHVHLCWFGRQWVLAVPPAPRGEPTDVADWSTWSIDSGSRIEAPIPALSGILLVPQLTPLSTELPHLALPPSVKRESHFKNRPLCDTARHERSGAQLI